MILVLAALLNTPKNESDWSRWAKHHDLDHLEIVQAIAQMRGVQIIKPQLDPIPFSDFATWLESHQQLHTAMTGALGVQSSDIEELDPRDQKALESWIIAQYQEHYWVRSVLEI